MIASTLEEALRYGPFDVAIYALKSFDTASALEGIEPFAAKMPPILCLSNGVENESAIASVLGADKVIHGTVTSAIGRHAAGDILLEKLKADSGSGSLLALLPEGDYPVDMSSGSESITVETAAESDLDMKLDVGSGRIVVTLADGNTGEV